VTVSRAGPADEFYEGTDVVDLLCAIWCTWNEISGEAKQN
jgi:hypothetical protein